MSIRTDLDTAWAEWLKDRNLQNKLTQGATWRRDNPGEWSQLQAYRNGGAKPNLSSITGKQMVAETSAWLQTAVAPPPPVTKPTVPTGLTVTSGDGKATLSWDANPASQNVDGYQIYVADLMSVPDVDGLTYVASNLNNGQTYSFRISAHNSAGHGDWTEAVTVTPQGTNPPPPPPPSGFVSPLGYHSNRTPGYFPGSNIDKYSYISAEGPAPAAFRGVNSIYRSGITCGAGYTNFSESVCIANGWAMMGTDGTLLRNSGYGGVLADPGLPAYQQAWCEAALQRARQLGADGFWIDDTTPRVADFSGRWPAKYPNMQSYMDNAMLPFAAKLKSFFDNEGLVTTYNTGISSDDDASLTQAWWRRMAPLTDGLTQEYWIALAHGVVRRSGAGNWDHFWENHRALHQICNETGTKFLPLSSIHGQVYTLATFLLDWNGQGSCTWVTKVGAAEYVDTVDPWIPQYAIAATLDPNAPPATKSGNVWSRFNGRVKVDPVAGTASIT